MNRNVLPVLISLALTACFSPVPEAQCLRDLDCDAGTCVDTRCVAGGTGGGGTNTGGGTSVGGGGTGGSGGGINVGGGGTGGSGGGINVGGGMGGSGGGVNVGGGTGGSGGGGPVGGGGGSGVDAGVCNCRDGLGGCQPGNSPIACGTNGSQCMACGFGQQCQNGACVSGACGPQSCAGCCTNNFCVVPGQQSRFACGLQGQACAQCPMGQSCQNGSCTTPVCDVVTCPTGCCANGQCDTSASRFSCGVAGQMCMRCPMGQNCTGGVCLPTFGMDAGVPDAGTTVAVGSACTTTSQCQPPFNANCIQEVLGGQPTGYTGGYCTRQCSSNNPCTTGAVCITESFFGAAQSTCRATCAQVGQQSSCRTGYVCAPSQNSTTGFCRARCDVMGALSACAAGQTCNVSTGVCQ